MLKSLDPCFDGRRDGYLTRSDIIESIAGAGIRVDDVRIQDVVEALPEDDAVPSPPEHMRVVTSKRLVLDAIQGRLVVPDWSGLCATLTEIHGELQELSSSTTSGSVSSPSAQLKGMSPMTQASLSVFSPATTNSAGGQQFSMPTLQLNSPGSTPKQHMPPEQRKQNVQHQSHSSSRHSSRRHSSRRHSNAATATAEEQVSSISYLQRWPEQWQGETTIPSE